MLAWSRRLVIAKALAAIRDELAPVGAPDGIEAPDKAARFRRRTGLSHSDTTKIQLERALLAIDVFPRCALLLSVFERMSVEDAALLLDADLDLVRKAQMIGLQELTRNLARMQGWTSTAPVHT